MAKYRRILKDENSKYQSYQIVFGALILAFFISLVLRIISFVLSKYKVFSSVTPNINFISYLFVFIALLLLIVFFMTLKRREYISELDVPEMQKGQKKLANRIFKLFNDKQITDVLKLSNSTRYGEEMPNIYVFVDNDCESGYVAIENIANFEKMDKEKYEQKVSGIFNGKLKRFAIVSSDLTSN
ncbi:cell division protein FtsK, partial [Staphylococcus epidermidis]